MKNLFYLLVLVSFTTASAQKFVDIDGSFLASVENYIVGSQSATVPTFNMTPSMVLVDSSGVLYDSGGPDGAYGPGELFNAIISIPDALGVRLSCELFETESPYDSMQIINQTTGDLLLSLSGSQTFNLDVFGSVQIFFFTNAVNHLEGFEIRWDGLYQGPLNESENKGPGRRIQYFGDQASLRVGTTDNGWNVNDIGNNSIAVGKNSDAKSENSAAFGEGTQTLNPNSLAIGQYNVGDGIFEIGNGTNGNRSNFLTVTNTGRIGHFVDSPGAGIHSIYNSSLSNPHLLLQESGNDYARINFKNSNGSNYWTIAAYVASNNQNDRLNFWNGTSGDVMTITGDGEVGIGVGISPKVPFHIGNGRRVLFGTDTLGNGDKLMFLPDLHAFRVGTLSTGASSTYWNRDSIGLYSFASGLNTRAQGFGATALGRDTEATNSYAFASGFFTNADGQYSTAMGFNTDAFAIGSTAGATDVLDWLDIGLVTSYQAQDGLDGVSLSLTQNTDYFVSIRALDESGKISNVLTTAAWQYFVPENELPSMILWLDGKDLATVKDESNRDASDPLFSGNVNVWEDKSGSTNVHDFTVSASAS